MIPIRDSVPAQRFPLVTSAIITVNVLVFWHMVQLPPPVLEAFVGRYALIPARFSWNVEHGRFGLALSRILSSMFMHGGWTHLIGNMWFLWIAGDNVEDRMGRLRYLIFYLISGIAGAVLQVSVGPGIQVPNVGASGAIAGVLAAYMVFFPHARIYTLIFFFLIIDVIAIPAVIFLGIWFLFQFLSGVGSLGMMGAGGGVAWFAHIGGFSAGFLLGPIFGYHRRSRIPRRHAEQYLPW